MDGLRGERAALPSAGLPGRTDMPRGSGGGSGLTRTGALGLLLLGSAAVGALHAGRWPDATPALDCPAEALAWADAGASSWIVCGDGGALPPDVALGVGRRVDLNRAPEETLARLPGIGGRVAHQLVVARARTAFRSWEDVDAVPGVGPARLATLQRYTVLEP